LPLSFQIEGMFTIPPDSVGTGAGCTNKLIDRMGVDRKLNSEQKVQVSDTTEAK